MGIRVPITSWGFTKIQEIRAVACITYGKYSVDVTHNHNEEGKRLLWERPVSPRVKVFRAVASVKQDNTHSPFYAEYIFQLRQKAGSKMPSTKCIIPLNKHLQCPRNVTLFPQIHIILQGKYH